MASPEAGGLYAMSLDELLQVEVGIASRQQETVAQAPSAVTVFTQSEIRAMGIDNVYDLLNYVPGFQSTRMVDVVTESQLHTRGMANLNGDVLLMLNGHRLNENSQGRASRFSRYLSTANVKQVEVIRGPGSALYGSHAFLGVVNIITVTGVNEAELHAGANDRLGGYANLARRFGSLDVSASLGYDGDRGETYHRDGDYPVGPQTTMDPRQDLNLSSTITLRDTTLEVAYMRHSDDDFLTFNGVGVDGSTWSDSDTALVNLSHDWRLSEALLVKGGLGFTRQTMSSVGWFGAAHPGQYDYDRLLGPESQNTSYDANLDLTFHLDQASDLLAGLTARHEGTDQLGFNSNYFHIDPTQPGTEANPGNAWYLGGVEHIEEVPSLDSRETYLDNYGVYAQYRRELTTTLKGIAGLRYDSYEVTGSTVNPRLGLIWEADTDLTLKAFWGTAFRSPSLSELYTNSPRSLGNLALQPESIATTELVCQKRLRSVELEGVYFHNQISDTIERSMITVGGTTIQTWDNGSKANYDGLEARVIWDLTQALRLTLTHTHIFSDLGPGTYDDFSSLIANFQVGRWQLNLNGIYRPSIEDDVIDQGDYAVVNGRVSYLLTKTLTLTGKATNLLDQRYQTPESPFSTTGFAAVPNPGLRWLVGLEARW